MGDLAFIDTSGEQHPNGAPIDWHAVKASGVSGVYVKLSEGGVMDPHGQQDVRDAAAAGLDVGVYHFSRPDLNRGTAGAQAEAAAFNSFRAGLPCNCPPALDTETQPITQAWNDAWFAAVGDNAIGYTYRSARNTLSLPDSRVWIAFPNGPRGDYLGVQYGQGPVAGVPDSVDLDWFDPVIAPTKETTEMLVVFGVAAAANAPGGLFVSNGIFFRHIGDPQQYADIMNLTGPAFNGGQPVTLWNNGTPVADVGAFGTPADSATAGALGVPFDGGAPSGGTTAGGGLTAAQAQQLSDLSAAVQRIEAAAKSA